MVLSYSRDKIVAQVRSVWFIVAYLLAFQVLVLRIPLAGATTVAAGLGLAVVGLALFLEGIVLGLMPLGEMTGLRLPRRFGLPMVLAFAFLLGFGATFAEPAIGVLRLAGSALTPQDAPLLYRLLNQHTEALVGAVGIGVGLAVALGMLRFCYGWSLKPLIVICVALLAGMTAWAAFDRDLGAVLGLAWDTGGVTTGPVTVPLVLALGMAMARASGRGSSPGSGFGLVTLASIVPVMTVLVLGLLVRLEMWPAASVAPVTVGAAAAVRDAVNGEVSVAGSLWRHTGTAARAILPLSGGLIAVLLVVLRERPRRFDEIVLGVALSLVGMAFLGAGIEVGLARLGGEVGRRLPGSFRPLELAVDQRRITPFDPAVVQRAITTDGQPAPFFYLSEAGQIRAVPYEAERFDASSRTYVHTPRRAALFGPKLSHLGILVVFLFAFGMGYGATLAEPALNALGRAVEGITVGTFRSQALVRSVSVGVGIGMVFGVARVIWDLPLPWLLIPPYLVLLPLTLASSDDTVALAWDCAGVTTGPVTVPLVLAMGLGVGGELGVPNGFGILALASVYPILTVLLTGLVARYRQHRAISATEGTDEPA